MDSIFFYGKNPGGNFLPSLLKKVASVLPCNRFSARKTHRTLGNIFKSIREPYKGLSARFGDFYTYYNGNKPKGDVNLETERSPSKIGQGERRERLRDTQKPPAFRGNCRCDSVQTRKRRGEGVSRALHLRRLGHLPTDLD